MSLMPSRIWLCFVPLSTALTDKRRDVTVYWMQWQHCCQVEKLEMLIYSPRDFRVHRSSIRGSRHKFPPIGHLGHSSPRDAQTAKPRNAGGIGDNTRSIAVVLQAEEKRVAVPRHRVLLAVTAQRTAERVQGHGGGRADLRPLDGVATAPTAVPAVVGEVGHGTVILQ